MKTKSILVVTVMLLLPGLTFGTLIVNPNGPYIIGQGDSLTLNLDFYFQFDPLYPGDEYMHGSMDINWWNDGGPWGFFVLGPTLWCDLSMGRYGGWAHIESTIDYESLIQDVGVDLTKADDREFWFSIHPIKVMYWMTYQVDWPNGSGGYYSRIVKIDGYAPTTLEIVPEPATLLLLGLGVPMLSGLRRLSFT